MDVHQLQSAGFHLAPSWALLVGQIGRFLIVLAAILFLNTSCAFVLAPKNSRVQIYGTGAFMAGILAIFCAGACLAALMIGDQFEFRYVAEHSWKDLTAWYKIAAVWSGQQGSFLLWATSSALFGLLTFRGAGVYRRWYLVVFALFLAALCGILAFETPFSVYSELSVGGHIYAPPNGRGLVPSLQNYWVVVHPPTIFLGFGSLTVLFAYSMSAMLSGDLKTWIPSVRPWALLSLTTLGLGLVMGGLWAYETQGWGGFWAWDPVENVSLVPWLLVVAFIHGIIVQTSRGRWSGTNALLGALPFLLFFYGTFLTRSGFLDKFSVHSFAEMNRSALWILLGALVIAAAAFVVLWLFKGLSLAKALDGQPRREGFSREVAYQSGMILLICLACAIAVGMSVPFLIGLLGKDSKVVDEPLYHQVTVWFFVPIIILMAVAPFLSWKRMGFGEFVNRFMVVIAAPLCLVAGFYFLGRPSWALGTTLDFPFGVQVPRLPWVMLLFYLTAVAIVGNIWRLLEMVKRSTMGVGGFLAHMGVATVMAGLILSRGLEKKEQALVMEGAPAQALGYTIKFRDMTSNPMTDRENKVEFSVASLNSAGADSEFVARPRFFYNVGDGADPEAFTGPHVERSLSHDVYLSLARPLENLWDEPQHFSVGETKTGDGVSITYVALAQHGQPGRPGTVFGARLKVVEDGITYYGEPKISIGAGPDCPKISPSLKATLSDIDASDHSIMLQMPYTRTLFPIELYYKPMTVLIWVGTMIMTIGGLLSAIYRRLRR